jgi:hypothetical protein
VSDPAPGAQGGKRGEEAPARGFGGSAPEIFFLGRHIFAGFRPILSTGRHISGMTYFRAT